MSQQEIKVYLLASTHLDYNQVVPWLEEMGVEGPTLYYDTLMDGAEGPDEALIALAGKRCYKSFQPGLNPNVTKIREDYKDYFDNILASGHGSVLEHASFTFAFENVTRVFTAEMNRHRAGVAISEGSMRFIRFEQEIPYWLPTSLRITGDESPALQDRKLKSQKVFEEVFHFAEEMYRELLDIWNMDADDLDFNYKKKVTSCLRRIVPIGVSTGGLWTMNVRALRHIITMRASAAAEEEILLVFSTVAKLMSSRYPLLFGDFIQTEGGYWIPKFRKV